MPVLNCDFCDEFSGGMDNAFAARYHGELRTRILLSTDSFRVFPSIGQLVEGYLLIAPVDHYGTVADMPFELIADLSALHACVRSALTTAYGPCLSYEHGAHYQSAGGCGVYHAHLHIVPVTGITDPIDALRKELHHEQISGLLDLKQKAQGSSYLYYDDSKANRYLFRAEALPSQYLRKLLAKALGRKKWDWRRFGKERELVATLSRLSEQFKASPTGKNGLADS